MPSAHEDLPQEVRRFILTSIPSVPFLEALLLMRGDNTHPWDAHRLAQALYTRKRVAADLLRELCESDIAQPAGANNFAYRPGTPELAQRLDALAISYSKNLVAVTDLIHSRLERRAQQFADAFRWKKED
ncbi:MAG: hypothetical protein V4787_18725 [Pseudomonadota bacterium]